MSRLRSIVATALVVVPLAATAATAATARPAQAAGTVPSAISLSAPASGVYGSNISLTGRLWRYGTAYGIGGALVWLQRAPHGRTTWANIKTVRTVSNGNYAFTVTQTGAYDYRTVYTGSATYRVAISPTRYPVTNQRLTLESVTTTNANTGALQTVGYVHPLPPNGVPVYLQRWSSDAQAWHNIGSGRTSSGKVTATATRPGSVSAYRLVIPGRSSYGAGISAAKWFTHYVWRGAFVKGVVYANDGGILSVPKPADNPQRDRITHYASPNSRFEFAVDPSGCRHVATSSRPSYLAGAVTLMLYSTRVVDEATMPPDSTVTMSGAHDPADPRLSFHLYNPTATGAELITTMRLLCAN